MSFEIEELIEVDDLRELAELWARVWERPGEPLMDSGLLRALAHSGNYIAGARSHDGLAGGIVGWFGGHPPHDLHVHSHILGVLPGIGAPGLGFALKQHQRTWCLERGIKTVEWTFDPLVRRNAYFNLTKLGAGAARYLVDFYGAMSDGINTGDESDRILISWDLVSPRAEAAARGAAHELATDRLAGEGAARALVVGVDGEPHDAEFAGPIVMLQVPDDIVAIRRTQPELARRWRHALRASLGGALSRGYSVLGVTRDGWYVLELRRK